jgi:hypothetical protein
MLSLSHALVEQGDRRVGRNRWCGSFWYSYAVIVDTVAGILVGADGVEAPCRYAPIDDKGTNTENRRSGSHDRTLRSIRCAAI